jgi:hypothetical protein
VPEVNAGFEQFLHGYCGQTTSYSLGEANFPDPAFHKCSAAGRPKAVFAPAGGTEGVLL